MRWFPPFIIFLLIFIYFVNLQEQHREKNKISPLLVHSSNVCNHQAWVRAEARIPKLNPGLQCGWQGCNYLSHHLLSPMGCISGKLEIRTGDRTQAQALGCRMRPFPSVHGPLHQHTLFLTNSVQELVNIWCEPLHSRHCVKHTGWTITLVLQEFSSDCC